MKNTHADRPSSISSASTTTIPFVLKSILLSTELGTIKDSQQLKSYPQSDIKTTVPRNNQLKNAMLTYEDRVEEYYHQLTVGCGKHQCHNKFCASGRGGILSLQPQAALMMAVHLSSMPYSRLCLEGVPSIMKVNRDVPEEQEEDIDEIRPFLSSLFSATPFASFIQPSIQRRKETVAYRHPHWSSYFWKLISQHEDMDNVGSEKNTDDTSYYQIDNDSVDKDFYHNGLLLAIPSYSVDSDTAIRYLHESIVTKSIRKEDIHIWCRSIFQSWEGIGNSFLNTPHKLDFLPSSQRHVKYIDLDDLNTFFHLIMYKVTKKTKFARQIRIIESISDSIETLLDKMYMNTGLLKVVHTDESDTRTMIEWCRSLMATLQWILVWMEMDNRNIDKMSDRSMYIRKVSNLVFPTNQRMLVHKLIQVLSKISQSKKCMIRRVMVQMLSSLDNIRMKHCVDIMHHYLLDHFHTGPYKHGSEDTIIMALKCLGLLYESNMKDPAHPIVPPETFYSVDILKKLNIKNEYRIWKRVLIHGEGRYPTLVNRLGETEHQRRSRLFMTTTSTSTMMPYPFENEYQFSWFNYPFIIPPSIKRKIVLMDSMAQMSIEYEDACVNHTLVLHAQKLLSETPNMTKNLEINLQSATCPYLLLEIRREHFLADTLSEISSKWGDLKKPLKVKFIEGGEEGMDQGGVQKEFFGVLFEKLVTEEIGLFSTDENTRLCWIRNVAHCDIRMYEMSGVMMGLSIYNGVFMNLQFPKVLWKILVLPNEAIIDSLVDKQQLFTLDDLEDGWPDLGHGLRQLLEWEGEVEDIFCRDYEISIDLFGQGIITESLMPHKSDPVVPVTNANREEYVRDYCKYFMYTAQKEQLLAIRRGLWSVIGSSALNLCSANELEMIACGLRQGPDAPALDMKELEKVTEYDDGYSHEHPTIRQFWSVVHQMTEDQKRQLLLFVTANDRIPVGGLKELTFYIQRNGPDSDRLPTALTCFSRLLLPEYDSKQKLQDRLITAIENTKGFGLV
ncbi:hypothetical protein BDB01DRAFT_722731 [Pilobolus umbonatus]|nr:hypothetical protein BDB01DRAFT_722731 [Pilobolus umbonatus]